MSVLGSFHSLESIMCNFKYIITQLCSLTVECIGYHIAGPPHSSWYNIKVSHRQHVADTHTKRHAECVWIPVLLQIPNLMSFVRVPSAVAVE